MGEILLYLGGGICWTRHIDMWLGYAGRKTFWQVNMICRIVTAS